jgi:hypothetical protein
MNAAIDGIKLMKNLFTKKENKPLDSVVAMGCGCKNK